MDSAPKRLAATLAATAASSVLFYFGTGLTPVAALTWLAFLPILLLAPRVGGWTAALTGLAAGLLGACNLVGWMWTSHDLPMWPFGPLILLSFSLPVALGAAVFRALVLRGRLMLAALAVPAIWVSLLFLVSKTNPQGIMGTLASPQADVPLLMQSVSVIGMWGLEFLVPLLGSTIAALLAPGVAVAARLRTASLTGLIAILVLGGGAWRLNTAETGETHRVAMMSRHDSGWGTEMSSARGPKLLTNYLDEIDALDDADTVVLPEGEFTATPSDRDTLIEPLARKAESKNVTIVVGYTDKRDGKKYNTALTITPGGEKSTYHKHHDMVSPPTDDLAYQPGTGGDVAIEICGDTGFADPSNAYGAAGARLALIPAADEKVNGWMHSRTAMLRAAENGFGLAWAARTGTLTAADGYGRLIAETPTGDGEGVATVVADIPEGPGRTGYAVVGEAAAWLAVALAVVSTGFALRRNRRGRGSVATEVPEATQSANAS